MKIDIFNHVIPNKYKAALYKCLPEGSPPRVLIDTFPTLYDMDQRFRIMDKFDGLKQVITLALPPLESIADPERAAHLARIANDGMAELVHKYPDRFIAAVACLPMNNIDEALKEIDRTINDLNFKGVQINTPVNDKPLDSTEFMILYEKMIQYDLPIWIHPVRSPMYADYKTEQMSKYSINAILGWPYETSVAMTRLVLSGVLERYPGLKIIIHHCGAMIPYLEQRMNSSFDTYKMLAGEDALSHLKKTPMEYFRMFYTDTAVNGSTPALMCGRAFFGTDNILFATDLPFDNEYGERSLRQTIQSIEHMSIEDYEKNKIFEGNARKLLRLPE